MACAYSLDVYHLERKHLCYVCVVEVFPKYYLTQSINRGVVECLLLGQREDAFALGVIEELTVLVEQLERIPLLGVMRGGDNDAAVGLVCNYCHLGARGGAESDVDDVGAASHECAFDDVVDHGARDAGVAADNDCETFASVLLAHEANVRRCELDDVDRGQVVALCAADRTSDA